uniref:SGNH domain-containing protein n=1 Tax=Panagrolaimus davidi TaxID=227884 RepID=A0A914QQ32_9BILA
MFGPDEIAFLDTNVETYNPILANEKEAASCWKTYYPCENGTVLNEMFRPELLTKPACSYSLTPNSNKTIVILGNSFALNQSKGILKAIKEAKTKFNKAYLLVVYGCNVLTGNLVLAGHQHCTKVDKIHSNFLKELKPDVVIFSGRFDQIRGLRDPIPPEDEITKHKNYKQLQNILKYANFTKKFILIETNPVDTITRKYHSPLKISEDLLARREINQYIKYVKAYNETNYKAWEWVKTVTAKCKNCKIVPTRDLFCDEKICNFVDIKSKLGLYCDESHITPRTSLKLIPRIKDAIDN